jgi:hypothetical protein
MALEGLRDATGIECTLFAIHYALDRLGLPLEALRAYRILDANRQSGAGALNALAMPSTRK